MEFDRMMERLVGGPIVELDASNFINLEMSMGPDMDASVRQHQEEGRIIYLGQASQVVLIPESDLDRVIEFLREAKKLPLVRKVEGFLK